MSAGQAPSLQSVVMQPGNLVQVALWDRSAASLRPRGAAGTMQGCCVISALSTISEPPGDLCSKVSPLSS